MSEEDRYLPLLDECRDELRKKEREVNVLYDELAKCQGRENQLKLQLASIQVPTRAAILSLVEAYNAAVYRITALEELYETDPAQLIQTPSEAVGVKGLRIPAEFAITAQNMQLVTQRADIQIAALQRLRDNEEDPEEEFEIEPMEPV